MNVLLDPPDTVVCVVSDSPVANDLTAVLSATSAEHVVTVETVDGALERADPDETACVVLHDGIGADAVVECCRRIDALETAPPVVVIQEDRGSVATEAAVAGGAVTVRTPSDEQIRTLVDRLARQYRDRRIDEEDSEILDAMLSGLETALYAKDTEGRHLKLTDIRGGLPPEEAFGKTDLDLYGDTSPEFAREAFEDDMQVIESEVPVVNRDENQGPTGNEHWLRTTTVPWYDDDGRVKGLVGITYDITELKHKAARLEEVRERFEEFATHHSHDLQNPLQVASGYVEMTKTADDAEPLERADEALGRMEEMIEDMSGAASHHGPTEESSTSFPLASLVEEIWSHLTTGDAHLVVDLPDNYIVNTRKPELRPLFENLLQNAIEHGAGQGSSKAGLDVTVEVGVTDDGGFYVADDGPGIPEADRDVVMDADYTTKPDGTGAGLHIVDSIATQNDWRVTITESDTGGARFEIRNCLGVRDRPAHESRQPLELSETADVEALREPGYVEYDDDTGEWLVAGDGEDIWDEYNDFKFAYTPVAGPVSVQANVASVEHVAEFTKAGVMVRSGLDEDATYGYAGTTPGRGTEILWRTKPGQPGRSQQLVAEPFEVGWYRVDRVGDRVTTYLSTDGAGAGRRTLHPGRWGGVRRPGRIE